MVTLQRSRMFVARYAQIKDGIFSYKKKQSKHNPSPLTSQPIST
jgi:hypothetical protein